MSSPDYSGHRPGGDAGPARSGSPTWSLKDYVERELAAIAAADGPTMTQLIEEADRLRRPDGPTTADIVAALHEGRREREEQIDSWWP